MTHQQILAKAIQKAINNGWNDSNDLLKNGGYDPVEKAWYYDEKVCDLEKVIFNHDFAKALWSNYWYCQSHEHGLHWSKRRVKDFTKGELAEMDRICAPYRIWQYHLQEMVISDEPIQYLGEHI